MDGITFGYMNADAWLYLRKLCDGNPRKLNSAGALAHARTCPQCVYWLAEIAAGRPVARVRDSGAGTVVLTKVMTAVAS